MEIHGYKSFDKGLVNRYGFKFKVGDTYEIGGPLSFGNDGNGLHFCKRLEDTLKFFDGEKERVIAEVTSLGEYHKVDDEEQDFYDMYVARKLRIDKILTRKEILDYILNVSAPYRVKRFIMYFKLTKEEIEYFKIRYAKDDSIIKAIQYYQEGIKDIYEREYKKYTK